MITMNINYDESLQQNPFFQLIQENHSDIIAKATDEDWIICVPRIGTMEPTSISTEDIFEHILVPNFDLPDTHFCTLTKQEITIRNRCIVLKNDQCVRILFDETFYINKGRKYKLWCIEQPLHQHCALSCDDYQSVKSVHDCVKLLWTKNRDALDEINKVIEKFLTDSFEFDHLQTLKDKTAALYDNCIKFVSKDALAVETYMHHCVHYKLFRAVCNCTSQADANFNKIIRNLSDVQLKDLEISSEFYESIAACKRELSLINKMSTILGKIECLRRVVNTLSCQKRTCVTTDDLLKIFVLLIIKSSVNNWLGNLTYVAHFNFNALSDDSFLLTTLEAALEFIKSGDVRPKSGLQKDSLCVDSLDNFFKCVELGNLSAIRQVFDAKSILINEDVPLCHPLCACDKCKSYTPFGINSRNDKGCTVLHTACLYGQPHVVEYLLSKGVEISVLDHSESTPLHYAAARGNQNALLLLLHAHAEIECKDCNGDTPLHLAANNGHENCTKALLYFAEQKGSVIDVNACNRMGDTPLHLASKWGYSSIVAILLQYGAQVNITNKHNQSALDIAHNDHLKRLLAKSKDEDQILSSFEVIKVDLWQAKTQSDYLKKTDLVLKAIENNDLPLMCFYLGIPSPQWSTNIDTKSTCHPLCACEHCQKHFQSNSSPPSLDSEPININSCNSEGFSALHIAAKSGRTEILRLLLDAGALVNVNTSKHSTPLHLACKNQRIQIVRELLQCGGCDVDAQDSKGNTPLHYACLSNDSRIVELLLSNGSNCNVKNTEGKTPLQEAKGRMLCNIVRILKGQCESEADSLSDLFSL